MNVGEGDLRMMSTLGDLECTGLSTSSSGEVEGDGVCSLSSGSGVHEICVCGGEDDRSVIVVTSALCLNLSSSCKLLLNLSVLLLLRDSPLSSTSASPSSVCSASSSDLSFTNLCIPNFIESATKIRKKEIH